MMWKRVMAIPKRRWRSQAVLIEISLARNDVLFTLTTHTLLIIDLKFNFVIRCNKKSRESIEACFINSLRSNKKSFQREGRRNFASFVFLRRLCQSITEKKIKKSRHLPHRYVLLNTFLMLTFSPTWRRIIFKIYVLSWFSLRGRVSLAFLQISLKKSQ